MTSQDIQKFIQKNKLRHLSNKVLHTHPSPAHWLKNFSYNDIKENLLTSEGEKTIVNMYVGIPYCLPTDPPHCGFCLFPTEKYNGKKDTSNYLDYVSKEAKLYKDFYKNSTIETLYIGGGTPNLLAPPDYYKLMEIIEYLFPKIDNSIEKTLEGIPQLFNEEKIKAISNSGFNRVSMGVQQVSDKLIKASGRKQTRKQVFDAINNFHKYDLSCNIDLIYGWPEQSIDDMLNDLREITESGIRHITHYELNIAGRSDFATKQKELVASIPEKIIMYQVAKEYLLDQGYKQRTVYDWEKCDITKESRKSDAEKYLYENNLRDFLRDDEVAQTSCMGGLGFAAINMRMKPLNSTTSSVSSMNHKTLHKYYDDVLMKKLPIERAFAHTNEDVRLIWVFQSLQEMKIDVAKYKNIFKRSLKEDFSNIWQALEREQWIEFNDEELRLTGVGEFYVPLIQSLISKSRVDEIASEQSILTNVK
ncbi:coproporphyrinogen-III oxidase family protein [Aquimarina sp. RZ0]|uniref:coproporphyrinogen-III oxidase family protein n=1 Tax=Aquimarina sp. RZ0 TaxID=2607730 RepID=UPI0011F30B8F|nr:radical SAM protein [Aquimarina sp. RZ0]KAA1246076.1 radical SAM protein [Aquimarina sp. RZ0]